MANKKLSQDLNDIEKTEEKIAELQEHLKNARRKQKTDEDLEIIKAIRGKKMTSRELLTLLNGIEEGSVEFAFRPPLDSDTDGDTDQDKQAPDPVPESEVDKDDSKEESP